MKYLILPLAILAFMIAQCDTPKTSDSSKDNGAGIVIDDLDTAVFNRPAIVVKKRDIVLDDLDVMRIPFDPESDGEGEPDSLRDVSIMVLGPGNKLSAAEMRFISAGPTAAQVGRDDAQSTMTISHPALGRPVTAGQNGEFFPVPVVLGNDTVFVLLRKHVLQAQ